MVNEQIVRRVSAEHEALRRLLAPIEALARGVAAAHDAGALRELRRHGFDLHAQLSRHLDFEERALLPAIEREGAWGRRLASRVRCEHGEQRLVLRYVFDRLADESRPAAVLGRDLESFAAALREDMALEEREVLGPLARPRAARAPFAAERAT